MTAVTQARRYHDAGWGAPEIVRLLAEDGVIVSLRSVNRWINPAVAEADRRRELRRSRRKASEHPGRIPAYLSGHVTDEYKFARMRALRDIGLSPRAIARVMSFDFGDDLTDRQVRHALERSGRYPTQREEATA